MQTIEPSHFTVIEVMYRWNISMRHIQRYAAEGWLTFCVMADGWEAVLSDHEQIESHGGEKSYLDDWVNLLSKNIKRSLSKDYVEVASAKTKNGKFAHFVKPVTVKFGELYMTRVERDRFEKENPMESTEENKYEAIYLDKNHNFYAPELEAGVSAWIALYGNNLLNSKRGYIEQIETWLTKNRQNLTPTAVTRIAKVVNAKKKVGRQVQVKHNNLYIL